MTKNQKEYKQAVIKKIQRKYEVDWITASKMIDLTNIDDSLSDYPEETMHDDVTEWVIMTHELWLKKRYPFL